MGNLTDAIEQYLRQLLMDRQTLEIQRRELAVIFRCAPSQINYVLETRFTSDRGYIIESRRGGGGYIRITRLPGGGLGMDCGERVAPEEMSLLLDRLEQQGVLSRAESLMLQESLGEALAAKEYDPSVVRARVLRTLLLLLGGRPGRKENP